MGGVLALAGFFAQRHGQRAGRPVAIRESTLHSGLGAAGCAALLLLGAAAYHAAYRFRHAQADPRHIVAVVATLIAFQLLVMIWVIRATGWPLAAVLWGCACLWTQVVAGFVAVVGPGLGAL